MNTAFCFKLATITITQDKRLCFWPCGWSDMNEAEEWEDEETAKNEEKEKGLIMKARSV